MEAKELMIGDWVEEIDRVCRVKFNTQIKEVRENDCSTNASSRTNYYDVQPIPLTVDVLTKNGFVFSKAMSNEDGDAYELVESEDVRAIVHDAEGKHTHLFLYAVNYPMTIERLLVNNVHELQHALRLYGINKEIEL